MCVLESLCRFEMGPKVQDIIFIKSVDFIDGSI